LTDEKKNALVPLATRATLVVPPAEQAIDKAALAAALGDLWSRLESADSRRAYRDDWRRYCAWLEGERLDPAVATVSDVQRYVNFLRDSGKAKSTRARCLSVLREVYRALVTAGVCVKNPAREVKNPKVDTTPKTPWLDEGKVQRLFEAAASEQAETWLDRRSRLMLLCLALLGWRRAEVARIRVEDFTEIVGEQGSGWAAWHTVKGGKRDLVGVPPYLMGEIRSWLDYAKIARGPIFPRSQENPQEVSGKIVYDEVKLMARAAGLDQVTPHALRRTYITLLERRGVDLRDLQTAVSHASVTTTERYQKASKAAGQAPGERLVDLVKRGK
jgi:integrase/recombinase XerD